MHLLRLLTSIVASLPMIMAVAVPKSESTQDVAKREEDRDDFYFFGISYDALVP
jgi:hypothetical protein